MSAKQLYVDSETEIIRRKSEETKTRNRFPQVLITALSIVQENAPWVWWCGVRVLYDGRTVLPVCGESESKSWSEKLFWPKYTGKEILRTVLREA